MTRFKLDENLGKSIKTSLIQKGFDVDDVYDEKIQGARDNDIFKKCLSEGRCLITLDTDFCNIIRFPYIESQGIIVLRPHGPLTVSILTELLGTVISALAKNEVKGKLWIVEPGRLRIHETGPEK